MAYTDKTPTHKTLPQHDSSHAAPAPRSSANSVDGKGNTRAGRGKKRLVPGEREQLVATAAYFRAQQRGFARGHEEEDWLQAETEVDRLLQK